MIARSRGTNPARYTRLLLTCCAMSAMPACTSQSNAPSDPNVPAAIITITSAGVSPRQVTVSRGSQVRFVNNDSQPHDMHSDPHPEHTDCPELDQVGFLTPGQSRQSGNLVTPGVCGFHDHGLPLVTSLQGTITIQ